MDPTKAARYGFQPKTQVEQDNEARERVEQAQNFLESDIWRIARDKVRETYVDALKKCPVGDDLQRFRLVEAINVIDFVENHIKRAYSDADVNLNKVITRDFKQKRGIFR